MHPALNRLCTVNAFTRVKGDIMKILVILTCLACLALTGSTMAQIDPDQDQIGVYFDTGATIFCIEYPVGAPQPAYLCITNPSYIGGDDEAVSGWECSVEVTEGVFVLAWILTEGAVNVASPPHFIVGLATPLPWSPIIVLMEMQVGIFAPGAVEFTLHPAEPSSFDPPSPGYAAGDDPGHLIPLGYSVGGEFVCAVINGECTPVGIEESTWGGIKAIYK